MKKISLQWKLTLLTTVLITILCGCLTFFLYKNGVYYFDTLQESVTDQGTAPEAVYIDIPDNEWDDFVAQFSMKVYNSKSDYRSRSLLITVIVALFGGAVTYFISGRALKPLREFSETVEKVQAQNLTEYTIEENKIAELDRLRISYNKMLMRLSEFFETQRQFTGNAAHELRTFSYIKTESIISIRFRSLSRIRAQHRKRCTLIFRIMNGMTLWHSFP